MTRGNRILPMDSWLKLECWRDVPRALRAVKSKGLWDQLTRKTKNRLDLPGRRNFGHNPAPGTIDKGWRRAYSLGRLPLLQKGRRSMTNLHCSKIPSTRSDRSHRAGHRLVPISVV